MAAQRFCPECGATIDGDPPFCGKCGANLADREPPAEPGADAPTERIERPAVPPPPPPPPPRAPRYDEPDTPADEEPIASYKPPSPAPGPEPPPDRRKLIFGIIAGVLVIAVIAVAVVLLTGGSDDTASGPTQSLDSILNEQTTTGTTGSTGSTGDGSFFPDEGTDSGSAGTTPNANNPNPAVKPKSKPKPPVQHASDFGSACGGGVAVNDVTTCGFAQNVASAYRASGSSTVTAHSDTTGKTYVMSCSPGPPAVCTGGNDASVFIDK